MTWIKPEIVAQIQYLEWTDAYRLRHSKFVTVRDDKNPRDVVKEIRGRILIRLQSYGEKCSMRLKSFFATVLLLLVARTAVAQANPNDSQTLEAILAEIRQLREDLRTATVAAQNTQILDDRVQMQETVVRHLQGRTDDTRSKLAQTQYEEKRLMTTAKQMEDALDQSENPKARKENEETIARLKAGIQAQSNSEQEAPKRLIELEEQLRIEQAKLAQLQAAQ